MQYGEFLVTSHRNVQKLYRYENIFNIWNCPTGYTVDMACVGHSRLEWNNALQPHHRGHIGDHCFRAALSQIFN